MFEDPGEVVRDEDGMQAGGECRIDIGARAVADHPGGMGIAGMIGGEGAVGGLALFGDDLYGGEVGGEAGAHELVGLLLWIALGDENEAVAFGEFCKGVFDGGEGLDLLLGDGLGEAGDAAVLLGGKRRIGELLEAVDEGAAEALQTVAVGRDGGVLAVVQVLADFLGSVDAVVEVGDERSDGPLEVDVVLPEGVVCVEE